MSTVVHMLYLYCNGQLNLSQLLLIMECIEDDDHDSVLIISKVMSFHRSLQDTEVNAEQVLHYISLYSESTIVRGISDTYARMKSSMYKKKNTTYMWYTFYWPHGIQNINCHLGEIKNVHLFATLMSMQHIY